MIQSSLVPVASSSNAHTARAAQLAQLQELVRSSQQLADSLGLSELAQNQRFWQARIQQFQKQQQQQQQQQQQRPQQQQEGAQPVRHQLGAAPCACRNSDCSCGAAAAAAETSTQQHANTYLPPSGAHAALCCGSGKQPGSGSTSRGTHKQPAAFTAQLPLTLARPMNPFDPGMPDVEMHHASKVSQQPTQQQVPAGTQQGEQQRQQQQQEPTHLCDDQQQTQQQPDSARQQHPQQGQQQQQEQVDARVHVRRVATLLAAHSEKHAAQQQQQQQAGRTQEPMSVDARPSGGFRSHHTSLLDALAVAAAVASEEASALEQSASAAFWPAAAAPTHAPPVLLEAASSSEQALLQAARTQAARPAVAGDNGSTRRRRSSSSSASAPLEPSTSTDNPATTVTGAGGGGGVAAAGGPARKSCLLELADQLGAAALATAQAAVEAGQPLAYDAVMQLLQPLETCVADVLGPPLQEVAEVKVDDVRRMFFYNQAHVAKHFGMGTTRFKPVLRGLGVRYWPQRQFMSIVEALNYLRDKSTKDSRDSEFVPGRMLVLQHAWYVINNHPNVVLDNHPATAVKKAIHKQSFKERQRGAGKQQQPGAASKMQNTKRSYAQMALAAGVGAAEEGEAGLGAGVFGVPREVTSQVFEALAVWPASLEYLATEASSVLLLPAV